MESSPDAVVVHRDLRFLFANPAALRLYGVKSFEELRNKSVLDFIHPDHLASVKTRIQQVAAGWKVQRMDQRIVRADGVVVDVEATGAPITFNGLPAVQAIIRDVTDRTRAEAALRENEERLHRGLKNSPIFLGQLDRDLRFTWVSHTRHGFEEKDVLGRRPDELAPPEQVPELMSLLQEVLATGKGQRRIISGFAGKNRWVYDAAAEPLFDNAGAVVGLMVAQTDIADREHFKRAYQESETRYRDLSDGAPDAIIVHSDDKFLHANPAALKLFRARSFEMLQHFDVLDLVHPDDREKVRARGEMVAKGAKTPLIEHRCVVLDGSVVPVESTTWQIDFAGTPAFQTVIRDITKRRKAEEARNEIDERFRSALSNSRDVIYRANVRTGAFDYISPSVETVTGFTPAEMMALSVATAAELIHPDDLPAMKAAIEKLEQWGSADVEYRQRTKSGDYRWLSNRLTLIRDGAGRPLYRIGNIRDITEQKQFEESLARSRQMLDALVNASLEGIMLIALDGKILATNSAMAVRLGGTVNDLIGANVFDRLSPKVEESRKAYMDEAVRSGQPLRFEDQREGSFFDNNIYPVADADGNISAVAIYTADITDHKLALEALQHLMEKERLLAKQLAALHEITSALQQTTSLDDLCRMAVELGRSRLHFERIGIWFCDGRDFIKGTFGTDEEGRTRDERDRRLPVLPQSAIARLMSGRLLSELSTDVDLFDDHRRLIGHGTRLVAAIWSGERITGCLFADNLLRHEPMTDQHRRLLELYASRVGTLAERVRAEDALRQSEGKYRNLHESMNEAYVIVEMDGRLREWNRAYREMLGYNDEELRGLTYMDVTPAKWHEFEARITREQLMTRRYSDVYEKEYRRKDGTVFPVELRTFIIRNDDGHPSGMWAIARDITERKRTEEALIEREQRARNIVSTAMDGFCLVNEQGRILDVNEAMCQLLGYTRNEILNLSIPDLEAAETAEATASHIQKIIATGGDYFESKNRRKNGEIISVEISVTWQPARQVLYVFTRDITARKQTEEALQRSEERFRSVLESSLDAAYQQNMQTGVYDYLSPVIERITGYTVEEFNDVHRRAKALWQHITNNTVKEFNQADARKTLAWVHPDDLSILMAEVDQMSLPGKIDGAFEYRLMCKDGRYRWLSINYKIHRDESGRPVRRTGNVRDVTERKLIEEKVRQSEERFRSVLENSLDVAYQRNLQTKRYEYLSPVFEQLTGYPIKEIQNAGDDAILALIHPDDVPLANMAFEKASVSEHASGMFEFRLKCQNGQYRWLSDFFTIQRDAEGKPLFRTGSVRDITEHKRVETAIQQSEARFRSVLENSVDVAYRWDLRQDRYEYISPIMEDVSGYKPAELSEAGLKKVFSLIHDDDRSVVEQEVGKLAALEKSEVLCEYRFKCRSGKFKWFADRFRGTRDENGRLTYITGVVRDITEQKLMEELLRQNEERFRTLAEAMPQQIWIADAQGRPEYANRRRTEYTGLSMEDVQAQGGWWSAVHPDDVVQMRASQDECVRGTRPVFEFEYRLRCAADGQYRWFLGRAIPIRDSTGQIFRWLATSTDIHDQKRAEETLRRSHEELDQKVRERTTELEKLAKDLAASEGRFRALVENINDIVYQTDAQGRVIYISPTVERYGLQADQVIGRHISEFLHPEDRPKVLADFARTISTGRGLPTIFRVVTPKGEFWCEDHGKLQLDKDGNPAGIAGVFLEITERVHAHQKLLEYQKQLRALVADLTVAEERERRRIAAGLHDDVGQMLIAAKIKLDQIAHTSDPSKVHVLQAEADRHLDRVMSELHSLTFELVSPVLQRLGFAAAVDQLCEDVRSHHGITITFDDDKKSKPLGAETEIILYHAVRELLRNVIRHAGAVNIRITFHRRDGEAEIIVEDDGKGFDIARAGGTFGRKGGFGLFTIRERMKHLGGRFEITSVAPRGTRIWLAIALAEKAAT